MTFEFKAGDRCGDYELLAFIGQGGMARVWSARPVGGGDIVAIKMLLPVYADNPVLLERLSREGQSQKALQHPNILRSHGTYPWQGGMFMVMDLVDGQSLEKYIERRGIMPVPEVRGVAQAVLSALSHAHIHSIVHRDVKPSNILLSRKGRILLGDFGIALLQNSIRLTQYGGMGTPSYMSPEQIVGREIDHRSDIYSVGCVLYELLTGGPPFHATGSDANAAVRRAHQYAQPEPLMPKNAEVPPALEKAVLCALEKNPANRFESCASFAAALGVSTQAAGHAVLGHVALGHAAVVFPAAPGTPPASTPSSETPRSGTPSGARVLGPHTPPGVTTVRSSKTPVAAAAAIVKRRPALTGIAAIGAGLLLAGLAVWNWHGTSPPGPPAPVETASSLPPAPAAHESHPSRPPQPRPAPHDNPEPDPTQADAGGIDHLQPEVAPLAPAGPVAATGPPVLHRPPPLAPPPGAAIRSSGTLNWAGAKGEDVEIEGIKASHGLLSGDALPGVPVAITIEGENGSVIQLPTDADGYKRLILRAGSSRLRIHWKALGGTGQTR